MSIGSDLLNVPMGDMIRQMAFAIADAQQELDESSMHVAELMSGRRVLRDADGNLADANGESLSPGDDPVTVDTRVYFGYDLVPAAPPTVPATYTKEPALVSMLELGFTPTFYQFVDTIIEVKIAIKITQENQYTQTTSTKSSGKAIGIRDRNKRGWLKGGLGVSVSTTQVDATYSSRYSYTAEGSSLLRTKLVPVPPPAVLQERIRALMEQNKLEQLSTTTKEPAPT